MSTKITAYQCKHCNSIYDTRAKADSCEGKCKRVKDSAEREAEKRRTTDERNNSFRLSLDSIDNLQEALVAHFKDEFGINLTFTRFELSGPQMVSNSHAAPIGGVTNWHRNTKKPAGYIGYSINVEGFAPVSSSNTSCNWFPDYLDDHYKDNRIIGIHIGCFNGGNYGWFKGNCYLFIQDFPLLAKQHQQ